MTSQIQKNPNVRSVRTEVHVSKDGTIETVLVVETNLELDATHPDYDKDAVDQLLADVMGSLGSGHDRALITNGVNGGTF